MLVRTVKISIGFMLIIGLGSALMMQLELFRPGRLIFTAETGLLYYYMRAAHIATMALGLPISLFGGLTCLILARKKPSRALTFAGFAVNLLAVAATIMVALTILKPVDIADPTSLQKVLGNRHLIRLNLIPVVGLIGCLMAVVHIVLVKGNRLVAGLCATLSVLALMASGLFLLIMQNAVDNILHDTWYIVAMGHTVGVALLFSALSLIYSFQASQQKITGGFNLNIFIILGLAALCAYWVVQSASLGLSGMPALYVDYVPTFAGAHFAISLAGFGLLTLTAVLVTRILRTKPLPEDNPADSF